jgi:gamma-glutamyltranspeptidase
MHVSVLTKDGSACSLTSTINLVFGSQLIDNTTDIILNDEMDDFSIPNVPNSFGLEPSPYNYVQGGKRPLSSSSPVIIEKNGHIHAVAGASGGSFITTATAQTIIEMLDYGKDAWDAVHAPRFHHQLLPNMLMVEPETEENILDALKQKGHDIYILQGNPRTGVAAIKRGDDGLLVGVGDSRKGGNAVAY